MVLLLNKRPRLFGVLITLIGRIPEQAKESGRNNKPVTGLKQDIANKMTKDMISVTNYNTTLTLVCCLQHWISSSQEHAPLIAHGRVLQ